MRRFDDADHTEPFDVAEVAVGLATRAREAAYTAVGLGVLGFQRAQVQRHELVERATDPERVAQLRHLVTGGVQQLDEWLGSTVQLVESGLEPLVGPLPGRDLAAKAVEEAVGQFRSVGSLLRQLVSPGA